MYQRGGCHAIHIKKDNWASCYVAWSYADIEVLAGLAIFYCAGCYYSIHFVFDLLLFQLLM
jgi:hypothetical protein